MHVACSTKRFVKSRWSFTIIYYNFLSIDQNLLYISDWRYLMSMFHRVLFKDNFTLSGFLVHLKSTWSRVYPFPPISGKKSSVSLFLSFFFTPISPSFALQSICFSSDNFFSFLPTPTSSRGKSLNRLSLSKKGKRALANLYSRESCAKWCVKFERER